jgi:NAD(P)-dependent dehydrogenase (short-subunit alcohol dehydrogenase family)
MDAKGTAVVTGASRGIGRAVALELAARGFDVLATMRNPDAGAGLADEVAAGGGGLEVSRMDVTDPASIRLPEEVRVLVNNAAVEREHPAFESTSMELWRAMYETNVFGLIEVSRAAIPSLRRGSGGVLCNVTSSSILAPVPFFAPYRSSKAAVSAIGESLRAELAPFGIRVLEIMPGPIDTDMLAGSAHPPVAIEDPDYAAMAQRYFDGRSNVEDQKTSTADAANAIVDAVLDDDAPLRVACDPLAVGLLDAWRTTSDEQLMQAMLPAWTGEATGEAS